MSLTGKGGGGGCYKEVDTIRGSTVVPNEGNGIFVVSTVEESLNIGEENCLVDTKSTVCH